jgi:hypothetical protein
MLLPEHVYMPRVRESQIAPYHDRPSDFTVSSVSFCFELHFFVILEQGVAFLEMKYGKKAVTAFWELSGPGTCCP